MRFTAGFNRLRLFCSVFVALGLWANGLLQANDCADCPRPHYEYEPGRNLYWHDPNCSWVDRCQSDDLPVAQAPAIYSEVALMPLFRDQQYATAATGETEFDAGIRATVGAALGDWYKVEASYLGDYSWSDTVGSDPFTHDFRSLELNLRRRVQLGRQRYCRGEVSFLLGARYLKIEETLGTDFTSNEMIGGQIGLQAQFLMQPRAWIDFQLKGVIAQNGISLSAGSEDVTAFVGDLSLVYNYQFAPAWTFQAGYNAIWVTGLALASENSGGSAPFDHTGRSVYHGPSLSLVWAH
ncbi:MAG: hypothetical protein MK165_00115 [Pirellulaceae bacterium]|nr:hypothetical protein [Pirellulaceae bacterium]